MLQRVRRLIPAVPFLNLLLPTISFPCFSMFSLTMLGMEYFLTRLLLSSTLEEKKKRWGFSVLKKPPFPNTWVTNDKWPECFGAGEFVRKRMAKRNGAVHQEDPSVTGESLYITFCWLQIGFQSLASGESLSDGKAKFQWHFKLCLIYLDQPLLIVKSNSKSSIWS